LYRRAEKPASRSVASVGAGRYIRLVGNARGDGPATRDYRIEKHHRALREANESRAALMKVRVCALDNARKVDDLNLESEAGQLAAIFATIILKMRLRLEEEARKRKQK